MPIIQNPIISLFIVLLPLYIGLKYILEDDGLSAKDKRMIHYQMVNPESSYEEYQAWESKQGIKGFVRKLGKVEES